MHRFDKPVNRQGTFSSKWDKYHGSDVLPMWVADTDFVVPGAIIDALKQRVDHGVFGYTQPPTTLTALIVERMQRLYDWQIDPAWIVYLPGLVPGLHLACRSLVGPGGNVFSPSPIYPPFVTAPLLSERQLTKVPMQLQEQRWVLDFAQLETELQQAGPGALLLFCNPHNPGGTVYTHEELLQLGDICERYDCYICSDEIHCDLLLEPGLQHIPLASLNDTIARRTITLMAPSKTFNIAGLGCSFAIISDDALRQKFNRARKGIVPDVSLLAYTAAAAAYQDGDDWLHSQLGYLRKNRDYCVERINAIPGLTLQPIEATYLAWIDASGLGVENPQQFFEQHGVGMSPGADFGNKQFVRLNFGCTMHVLKQALDRIEQAVSQR
ncbi:PatB family C-S lyase [Pokkaliibacter sp. MBI-7]|uniref:MalY/PatB family protein n=1 Tax=Pokkaliibacter sp. MBI-7 TaxID=3040600 RepID=UPI002449EEB3|nr:PatB family C-S lyase [Pokkaliibacter sp. MBI-7]MDH2433970.1 PatB family C-S lyase [Pokkaliibacter sp. MBI-7]